MAMACAVVLMIPAGKLDRRIGVLRRVVTHNALNEEIETWPLLATHNAEAITAMSGSREFAAVYKVYAEMGILFRLESCSGLFIVMGGDLVRIS